MKSTSPSLRGLAAMAIMASFAVFSPRSIAGDNLIENGNFESGLEGWEIFIGPEFKDAGAVATAETTQESAHDSTTAAVIKTDLPIRYGLSTQRKYLIPVEAGGKYRISGWVKLADGAEAQPGRAAIYIRLGLMQDQTKATQDPQGNIHVGLNGQVVRTPDWNRLITAKLPFDWTKIESEVEIPDGHSYVAIGLFVDRIKGAAYWDDIVLEKVSD